MKYHNTISKPTYMKMLGLAGVGHDLDEITASPKAEWKRPWWVRSVDKPTIEIDWDRLERFDARKIQQRSFSKYVGEDENIRLIKLGMERFKQWILENRSGYTLRDWAVNLAGRRGRVDTRFISVWPPRPGPPRGWGGQLVSPQELGVPQWEASPEENARMIRAVARNFGASQVGFVELDEHNRKFLYSIDPDGAKLEFEDVDQAYETDKKRVIPNKAGWVIVFTVQMSEELYKRTVGRAPTPLSSSTTGLAYSRGINIIDRLQTFLHVLGYQGLMGPWYNGLGIAPALGVMAGLGEQSRLNRLISPEYGPMLRVFKIVTDLPLAPDKPIDAGIMRFCRTCKKCAEACPSGTLSMETEPSWEVVGPWSNPGHRAYFEDAPKCLAYWKRASSSCSTCFAICPFSKKHRYFLHKAISATIAATPLLNGFFTRMDGFFNYDKPKDPESWWSLNLPPYGVDANQGTQLE